MQAIGDTQPRFGKYKNKGLTWKQIWETDADYCVYLVTLPDFAKKNYTLTCFIGQLMKDAGLSLEVLVGSKKEVAEDTVSSAPSASPSYKPTQGMFMPSNRF